MKKTFLYLSTIILINSCKSKTETSSADSTITPPDTLASATQSSGIKTCYLEAIGKDSTIVSLIIEGDSVSGEMSWLPWEKDGAIGTLKGKKVGNQILVDYDYVIEGSQQVEEKIFVLEGDKLLEKQGELEEKNGKLIMKDPSKATTAATLSKVDCK